MRTNLWLCLLVLSACGAPSTPDAETGGFGGSIFGGGGGGGSGGGGGGTSTGGVTGGGAVTGGGTGGGAPTGGGAATQGGSLTVPDLVMSTQVVSGADGVFHVSHHTSGGRIVYGRCATGCANAQQWQFALLEDASFATLTRLAVGPDQRVHLVYEYSTGAFAHTLIYATCASNCGMAGSWVKTQLAMPAECDGPENSGLVIDAQQRLSFLMSDSNDTKACLVTCAGNCSDAASWQSGLVATSQGPMRSAFVLAGHGTTLHLLFSDGVLGLRYQSCAGQCTNAANWQQSQALFYHEGAELSLTASPQGVLSIAYNQGTLPASAPAEARAFDGQLHLFQCAGNCFDPASWQGFSTGLTDGAHGVAISERGGQVAVATAQTSGTKLFLCSQGNCGGAAGWGMAELETITSLNAAMPDPYALGGCTVNGQPVAPQQASWHPEKPSIALGADALMVQAATNGLRTCPGSSVTSYPGNGRIHYVR